MEKIEIKCDKLYMNPRLLEIDKEKLENLSKEELEKCISDIKEHTKRYDEIMQKNLSNLLEKLGQSKPPQKTKTEELQIIQKLRQRIKQLEKEKNQVLARQQKINVVEKFSIPNTKVNNDMIEKLTLTEINQEINLNAGTKNKPINVWYTLFIDDVENIAFNGKRPLSMYDWTIHNIIGSIHKAGYNQFTLEQLTRVVYRIKKNTTVSKNQLDMVEKSINKLIMTRTTIDCKNQMKVYENLLNSYEGYLINADKATVLADNGKPVTVYILNQQPILFTYAEATRQIINVDFNLLDTKAVTRNTPEIISFKTYLLKRIEIMKNQKTKRSNTILYDTIFKNCDITIDNLKTRTQEKRYKDQIKKLLQEWKDKELFKNFQENKKGNKIISITIFH